MYYSDGFGEPVAWGEADIGPYPRPYAVREPFVGWALRKDNVTIEVAVSGTPNGPMPEANLGLVAKLLPQ